MSYQVIARKWRPQVFEEVTGQEVITQTLRNALEYDRLHHAYLFSGARGVGKTTTARILAKALNCHKSDKPTLTPCKAGDADICASCLEISESRSMDVLEIDAASHTGIDDVRGTIIENINFNPARDRYRVFIIDEVHQLSKPAFNALLKTVEEPPANVVFVMATTELHKVPETITSRCQEFQFRTISVQKIFDRLKLIANAEKIDITNDALRELARSGEGSMRDAQSNFDQVISFSGEKIGAVDVTNALGFAGVDILKKTTTAIAGRDARAVLAVVDDLIARGHDLRNFCRDVLGLFRDLLVFQVAGEEAQLFESAVFSGDDMRALAEPFTEADLVRFFNSLCETEASLREAAHPRYVLEIGLVKLIEMRSVAGLESILHRLDALASGTPLPAAPAVGSRSAAASADASPEKKTLKTEPPRPANDIAKEPPEESHGPAPEPETISEPAEPVQFVETPPAYPVRLPPLSAAELEHIDVAKLDDAYEEMLQLAGDDLLPIAGIEKIVEAVTGRVPTPPTSGITSNGSSSAAATAKAFAPTNTQPTAVAENFELPTLSADPTEEELRSYAEAHPAVQAAVRIFRAKIVSVTKR
jgi:DNA polymerase III subunit gamma/tau